MKPPGRALTIDQFSKNFNVLSIAHNRLKVKEILTMRDDNPNRKPIESRSFYSIPAVALIVNSVAQKLHYMKGGGSTIGAVHSSKAPGHGNFKANQRKERSLSRRRGMKTSARN